MVNLWRHKNGLEFQYKLSAIVAFGLAIQSLVVFWRLTLAVGLRINVSGALTRTFPVVTTSFLVWICLKQGLYDYEERIWVRNYKITYLMSSYTIQCIDGTVNRVGL